MNGYFEMSVNNSRVLQWCYRF